LISEGCVKKAFSLGEEPVPPGRDRDKAFFSPYSKNIYFIKLPEKQGLCISGFPLHCEQSEARGKQGGSRKGAVLKIRKTYSTK